MARDEPVGGVNERRQPESPKQAAERASQPDLGDEGHACPAVARNQCAVAEDEPPALVALVLRHGREQTAGLLIGKREQGHLIASVEPGDDPRRPAAEPSATGIEQNRARKAGARRSGGVHGLCHQTTMHDRSLCRRTWGSPGIVAVKRFAEPDELHSPSRPHGRG